MIHIHICEDNAEQSAKENILTYWVDKLRNGECLQKEEVYYL
jgi:hypothetical protein